MSSISEPGKLKGAQNAKKLEKHDFRMMDGIARRARQRHQGSETDPARRGLQSIPLHSPYC